MQRSPCGFQVPGQVHRFHKFRGLRHADTGLVSRRARQPARVRPIACRSEGLDSALQRQEPRRLGAEDHRLRARRQLRRHLPRRQRRPPGVVRQVFDLRQQVRPSLLRAPEVLALHRRRRVPLRRRAGGGRSRVGDPQQRPDAAQPVAAVDGEGSGLSHLGRGPAPRRPAERQAALDRQHVLARHPGLHQRDDGQGALPELEVADLRRRPVGARRGRGARRRAPDAQGRRADRPRVRQADDRRRRGEQVRPGGEGRRDAADRRVHRHPGREPPDRVPEDRAAEPLGLHGSEVAEVQELLRSSGDGACRSSVGARGSAVERFERPLDASRPSNAESEPRTPSPESVHHAHHRHHHPRRLLRRGVRHRGVLLPAREDEQELLPRGSQRRMGGGRRVALCLEHLERALHRAGGLGRELGAGGRVLRVARRLHVR